MPYQDIPTNVLSRLSHRPRDLLYSMITIPDPPKSIEAHFQNSVSSLGILDRLPVELLYEVLKSLDLQSTILFSRVSIQRRNIVYSFSAYRDVIKHTPHALAAFSQTKLLHLHSRCATCLEYGVYLFLPTCERCCWQCLRSNSTRRVVSLTAAAKTFALLPKMVQQLPVMFSILGTYRVACKSTQKSYRLVTIFSDSTCLDSLIIPDQGNAAVDRYFGMASILFPLLTTSDIVEHGLWCKGCEWTYKQYKDRRLSTYVIANMVPTDCDPDRVLFGMVRRARSKIRLSAHIRHCYGAQQLLADQGVQED
ncbi:F-box domain-containing protein [Nemania diffusa]|nr:F-box domain-containing protein [Nemania diffusa]